MNKKIFLPFISLAIVAGIIIVSSCQKDAKAVEPKKDYSFVQDFDSVEGIRLSSAPDGASFTGVTLMSISRK